MLPHVCHLSLWGKMPLLTPYQCQAVVWTAFANIKGWICTICLYSCVISLKTNRTNFQPSCKVNLTDLHWAWTRSPHLLGQCPLDTSEPMVHDTHKRKKSNNFWVGLFSTRPLATEDCENSHFFIIEIILTAVRTHLHWKCKQKS